MVNYEFMVADGLFKLKMKKKNILKEGEWNTCVLWLWRQCEDIPK